MTSPGPPAGGRIPMARVDRVWRGRDVMTAVGPLEVPHRDAVVTALTTLADAGPVARAGLRFDPESERHWSYSRDGLREWLDTCVHDLPRGADDDVDRLLTSFPPNDGLRPLSVHLADRHVVVRIDHALGDSRLATSLPTLLVSLAQGGELPRWTTMPVDANPLRTALRRTFNRPETLRILADDWRAQRHVRVSANPAAATVEFRPAPVTVSEMGPVGGPRAMQTWARTEAPGAALFANVLACVHRALIEEGIACGPGVHMVYDLRRYLPRGLHTAGNFVCGIDLPIPLQDPARITDAVTRAARSGRPLAALSASAARVGVARPPLQPVTRRPAAPAAQLALSYIGAKAFDAALPWIGDPDERRYWCRVDPAGPEAITLLAAIGGRRLMLSACLHESVFDAGRIRRALQAVHADPAGLLERAAKASADQ